MKGKRRGSKKPIVGGLGRTFVDQKSAELFAMIWWEGEALSDCVWKMNRQISDLRKEEVSKLDDYFRKKDPSEHYGGTWNHIDSIIFFPLFLNYSFVTLISR